MLFSHRLPYEQRRYIEENWHKCQFFPRSLAAHEAVDTVIKAENWCSDNLGEDLYMRRQEYFFFKNEEDLLLFKMTWL